MTNIITNRALKRKTIWQKLVYRFGPKPVERKPMARRVKRVPEYEA